MKEFIIAFPLPVSPTECQNWLPKNASAHFPADRKQPIRFPDIAMAFGWGLQPAHTGLSHVFNEHQVLGADECEAIDQHRSLLFLRGEIHGPDDFTAVQQAIHVLLRAGALGLYMEHSGCAHLAKNWQAHENADEPALEGWLNFVQKGDTLYTLGMECFQLSDLCIHTRHGNAEILQALLTDIADTMFLEGLEPDTGLKIQGMEGQNLEFRREAAGLNSKGNPYHNLRGTWRLIQN